MCFSPQQSVGDMVVQAVTAKPLAPPSAGGPDGGADAAHNGHGAINGNGKSTSYQQMYYMMASGQCSPSASSDTMDSGTCSDLESTPPPLPKKYSIASKSVAAASTPTAVPNGVPTSTATKVEQQQQQQTFSDDSEEGSESSLSFDSLNAALIRTSGMASIPVPPAMPTHSDDSDANDDDVEVDDYDEVEPLALARARLLQHQQRRRLVSAALPDSLLRDIRDRSILTKHIEESEEETSTIVQPHRPLPAQPPTAPTIPVAPVSIHTQHTSALLASLRPTGQPAHKRIDIFASHMDTLTDPASYENDRFYTFHINERTAADADGTAAGSDPDSSGASLLSSLSEEDSCFAGIRELNRLGGGSLLGGGCATSGGSGTGGTSTIRSAKGTVRGVKNRVRNGIATFLQMQQTNVKVRMGVCACFASDRCCCLYLGCWVLPFRTCVSSVVARIGQWKVCAHFTLASRARKLSCPLGVSPHCLLPLLLSESGLARLGDGHVNACTRASRKWCAHERTRTHTHTLSWR